MEFEQMNQTHKDIIARQDVAIGQIGKGVSRLHNIAIDMRSEFEDQEPLIAGITDDIDHTIVKTGSVTNKVKETLIMIKDGKSMCCIILCLLVIFALIAILILKI